MTGGTSQGDDFLYSSEFIETNEDDETVDGPEIPTGKMSIFINLMLFSLLSFI